MSQYTVAGISAGTIIGAGGAVSPVGDIPSVVFLWLQGVSDPVACLKWMKEPAEVAVSFFHPCYPNIDAVRLDFLSGGLVFIAIALLVWAAAEAWAKMQSS